MQAGAKRESVSRARLAGLLGGDEEGAREVLGLFLAEIPRFQDAFATAMSPPQFVRLVHRLRGSLLSLGLLSDAARLAAIESDGQDAQSIDREALDWIGALLPTLASETEQQLGSHES